MDQSTIAQMRPVLMAIAFRVCKCRLDEFKAAKSTDWIDNHDQWPNIPSPNYAVKVLR